MMEDFLFLNMAVWVQSETIDQEPALSKIRIRRRLAPIESSSLTCIDADL